MSTTFPAGIKGTLILPGEDGVRVQYSLEGIEVSVEHGFHVASRIELSALLAGEHFVDLSDRQDEELALLLELYGEQARLGASDEALATTRHRIREHVKKETA